MIGYEIPILTSLLRNLTTTMSRSAIDAATFTSPSGSLFQVVVGGVQGTRQPPLISPPVAPKFGGIVGGYDVWIGGPQ
jgi:hypothetical protein